MKTTGDPLVDNLFKENTTISSNHSVVAEFNINSYYIPQYYGTYTTSGMPSTFTVSTGYTSGINQVPFGGVDKDDKLRKKICPLYECFMPNRPNPGILKPVAILGNRNTIVEDHQNIRQLNYANSEVRVYPSSEKDLFKYWNSYRYIGSRPRGLSGANQTIQDTNPFVIYNTTFYANKIVIKTQKEHGYPVSFQIQTLNASNQWSTIITKSDSTDLSTGEIVVGYDGVDIHNNEIWSVVTSDADQSLATNLFDTGNTDFVVIKGIRFIVTKMSEPYCALELIEISPRMVIDFTSYIMNVSVEQSIGDSRGGLPVGTMVSSGSQITLSNDDRAFDRLNLDSIFTYSYDGETKTMLGQNVKFTIFQNIIDDNENLYKIKMGSFYTSSWSMSQDYSVSVALEDYIKFFREQKAPNLLIGFKNPLKSSIVIRMLLDNIGFNRFVFNTIEDEHNVPIDPTLKFFYCSNDYTVADVLNDIAKSLQLSIFIDHNNHLSVYTKEKVLEKSSKTYWFVGNKPALTDAENSTISTYIPNVESFSDDIIPPITSAQVSYKLIDIKKEYTGILEYRNSEEYKDLTEKISTDPGSLLTNYAYVNDILWQVGKESNESVLLSGILVKDISAVKPTTFTGANSTISADNEKEAIRDFFLSLPAYQNDMQIFLDSSDLVLFSQSSKYSGYIYIDSELIKFNGINYTISSPTASYDRILFSSDEMESIKASIGSGATFIPKSLIVSLQFKEVTGGYKLIDDGRAQEGSTLAAHKASKSQLDNTVWKNLSNMIKDNPSTGSKLGTYTAKALLSQKIDTGSRVTGFLRLEGPSALRSVSGTAVSVDYLPISDYGQRYVHGVCKDVGFVPQMFGTKMKLLNIDAEASKDTSSHTAGIAFFLTDRGTNSTDGRYMEGYYLEVSDNLDATGGKTPDDKANNIRLYRLTVTNTSVEAKVLGVGKVKLTPDTYNGFVNEVPEDGVISDFNLKVIISYPSGYTAGQTPKKIKFAVYWDNQLIFAKTDTSPLKPTQKAGVFVRDDSVALYDYIYAHAKNDLDPTISSDTLFADVKNLSDLMARSIISDTSNELWYFENFGSVAREAIKINAKFEAPTLRSQIIDISSANPVYLVKDYKPTSFGAEFWLYNTSGSYVILDESTATPLYIAGLALDYRADGQISYEDMVSSDKESEKRKILTNNQNLYGLNSISIETEYLNTREEAEKLLSWILENSLKEKKQISISCFPNPLIEVGDKVGVFYSDIGYSQSNIGDKTYLVSSISNSISESGPEMSIVLREC